jgi:very-short-patch-repair endonuclease
MVEVDSIRHHGTRAAFERDRRRDQRLTVAGWRVVRFTWRQIADEPAVVVATLRSLLGGERTDQADQ